jgi:hypothetical protein
MPNGRLGDHPLTDILQGARTFTKEIDALVKQVHGLGGFESKLARSYLNTVESLLKARIDAPTREAVLRGLERGLEDELDALRLRDHVRRGADPG